MLIIHTQKITSRIDYIFKHMGTRILGLELGFTTVIEEFIAHSGPKISYGKQPMGNELFFQSHGLLQQQGIEDVTVHVKPWGDTVGFFPVGEKSALEYDIFAAGFYLLSRYEEYLPHVKDELGRFPATESLAHTHGFLHAPVVDVWAYLFLAELKKTYPDLEVVQKSYQIHTGLRASIPFKFSQRGPLRTLVGYGRDLVKIRFLQVLRRSQVLMGLRKDPFNTLPEVIDLSKESVNPLTVFFLLGEPRLFEDSFNTRRKRFRLLVKFVADYKQVGMVFSQEALQKFEVLRTEKKRLEEITHRDLQASMNAEYAVHLPELYRELLEVAVDRDYSMVYQNSPGFRASTCTPFLFYDLDYEVKTPLVLHPIAGVTEAFLDMKPAKREQLVETLLDEVKAVHGTFTLIFRNTDFIKTKKNYWRFLFTKTLHPNESRHP